VQAEKMDFKTNGLCAHKKRWWFFPLIGYFPRKEGFLGLDRVGQGV
jgi:hypothetical protein